jgi:Domain of unknown function (DUF4399)
MQAKKTLLAIGAALALTLAACTTAPTMEAKPSEGVFFIDLADGATVTSPMKVKFGVTGKEVKPAGDATPNSGHHHLLVNLDAKPAGEAIPFDAMHIHYGKGQTEAEVKLPPGDYKLTMQFANLAHESYGPAWSKTIRITVK